MSRQQAGKKSFQRSTIRLTAGFWHYIGGKVLIIRHSHSSLMHVLMCT